MVKLKFILVFSILLLLYLLSFLNFISDMDYSNESFNNLKAVVILTGSKGRLGAGLEYMENNPNIKMLITGVGTGVRYSDLTIDNNFNKNNITLGFKAKNTFQNSIETLEWIKENKISEILLVTDNWHMKRSIFLFKSVIPNLIIYPMALETINFNQFFYEPKILLTIIIEHVKYIISYIQILYYWTVY